MTGRITSTAPAYNEHGVPFCEMLVREREANERLVDRLREALQRWLAADEAKPNSHERREAFIRARTLTNRVLN